MKMKFKAFTLAEILISLAIIGVVAAIATPVITSSIGDRAIISSVKKHYKAIQMAIAKSRFDVTKIPSNNAEEAAYIKNFLDKFSYVKYCADGDGCWPDVNYKTRGGSTGSNYNTRGFPSIVLADGAILSLNHYSTNYTIDFYIDINGNEGPNQFGRDLFIFEQYLDPTDYRTARFGPETISDDCDSHSNTTGWSCSYCAVFDNSLECDVPQRFTGGGT